MMKLPASCRTSGRLFGAFMALAAILTAQSTRLRGTVENGTTGHMQPGAQVRLLLPAANMQTIAQTRSRAGGKFQLTLPENQGTLVLEASYQGVDYFQTLPPAASQTQIQVFNAIGSSRRLRIHEMATVLQPENGDLAVVNEFVIRNRLSPPVTWYQPKGIFRFAAPRGIIPDGAQVIGPNGMPIRKNPHPARQAGIFRIAYPLRPGETRIQISYRIPYAQKQARVPLTALFPVDGMQVYVPPPMRFAAPGFTLGGAADGYQVYQRAAPQGNIIAQVSGMAAIPAAMQAQANSNTGSGPASNQAGASPEGAENPGTAQGGVAAGPASGPPRASFVERHQITLLLCLALLAAAGLGYMLSRPDAPLLAAAGAASLPADAGTAPARPADADLDKLKNELFLLEVRRNTGDIDAQEYERRHAALAARLRQKIQAD